MSSLANKLCAGLAAAAGIGGFAMPLIDPWYLLTVLSSFVAVIIIASGRRRIVLGACAFLAMLLVLHGSISAPLAVASLSAATLVMTGRVALGVCVLALNMTMIASAQELIGDLLHQFNLEAAGPGLLATLALALVSTTKARAILAIGSGLFTLFAIGAAVRIASAPDVVMALGAIPVTISAAFIGSAEPNGQRALVPISAVLVIAMSTWAWTPPSFSRATWLLLPNAPETYEAGFFKNYVEALRFAGVDANQASSAEEIPPGVTVLLPWSTAAFPNEQRIGELARERSWTVVIGGEHTNLGEVATRIRSMTGRALLRQDLTVPRGNTDDSGPMRISAIGGWPHDAILNRGASVSVASITDKVLLTGDGWWSEPDIGEWLWVGDYVWRYGDRAGRLAMAAVSDIGGARWVVLGDNSPLLNRQLVADPRAAIKFLQAASLWPSFLADLLVFAIAAALAFRARPALAIVLPLLAALAALITEHPSQAWKDYYLGETAFDERNFNNAIVENPALVDGRRLIRLKSPVSGKSELPGGRAIVFMLIEGSAELGGVHIDRCHRLGALATDQGPYLMDAQACRITGEAQVLVGSAEAAAIIVIGEALVILDVAFLSSNAPQRNIKWLLKLSGN
jgi:hypothetical protein